MAGDREYVPASNQSQSRPPQNQGDLFGPVPAAGIDRQAHIGPQAVGQAGRNARAIPPGGENDTQSGTETALVNGPHGIEFKAQQDAAIVMNIDRHQGIRR